MRDDRHNQFEPKWVLVWMAVVGWMAAGSGLGCLDDRRSGARSTSDGGGGAGGTDARTKGDATGDATGDAIGGDASGDGLDLGTLSDPVTVRFDDWGVPHIRCQRELDCFTAQGYVHARHRFFEMDLIRRQTLGELSEVIGTFGLDSDTRFRRLMTTREGDPLEDAYFDEASDRTKAMLRAYAEGVNAWLDDMRNGENGATLTKEYDNPIVQAGPDDIRDWEPEDTIALYLQLAYQLGESATRDLQRSRRMNALPSDVASDLFTLKPGIVSNVMDASGVTEPQSLRATSRLGPASIRSIQNRLAPHGDLIDRAHREMTDSPSLLFGRRTGRDGSNNWAVAPARTKNDNTLLANDPHLSLNNPAIWYWVEMHAESSGLHVAGASIPAVPGIVVGHNEDVAWGVTTARLDLADAYVEELTADGEAVKFDNGEIDLIEKEYTFDVIGGDSVTKTFEWMPRHGPIISKDTESQRAISIKWVAQNPGPDLDFLRPLMHAESTDNALETLKPIEAINQNWLIADRDGSIGWRPQADLPKRPWANSNHPNWLPLPGTGDYEWGGKVPDDELPEMVDPPADFIATANNDFDGSYTDGNGANEDHTPWQHPPAMGHRHKRIVERIEEGGDQHTVETMLDIQSDTHSLHGEVLVPEVLNMLEKPEGSGGTGGELSSRAQTVVEVLERWDYNCPTGLEGTNPESASEASDDAELKEAIGCSAFHVLMAELTEAVFADELQPLESAPSLYSMQAPLIYLFNDPNKLARGDAYFDDTTTNETEEPAAVVAEALEQTADRLKNMFGSSNSDDWLWGRIHTVSFKSLFAQAGLEIFVNGPYANDGGFVTVDVANPRGRVGEMESFAHDRGPSIRFVARANSDGLRGWFQLPGGQDHHRNSDWFGSLIDEWLANEPHKLLFEESEIEEATIRTLEFDAK
jgi:penicillin amidase